jgi:two-component system CheB/CheR fusion protein
MPVVTVHEQELLQAGTVYVVPSNHHIEVTEHDISLLADGAGRPKPSVDLLLSSASEVYGEQLVAVILTGTGSDGAMGARAVKQAGGTVVIQNPSTAAYPGMPQAVEPITVDIVADLPRIGPILFDLLTGVAVPTRADGVRELEPFLDLVREHTGIDFRSYKTPTILRRLQRRIIAVGASDLAGYTKYLEGHPDEYQRLASSFLIKVTDFMRDQELFDILRTQVIPDVVAASRKRGNELRFWSAGCATGEEAYSLAILLLEALGSDLPNFTIKIFATDLDGDAVAFARHGLYPSNALAHMPDELVERYFTRTSKGYEVKKLVRSLVVFGEHDLGQRAPFPRIDMVLCRNVLIYFTRELQQNALQLFAFALREGGYLVLGKTETVSPGANFFVPELPQYRIYRRHGKERPIPPFQIQSHALPSAPRPERRPQRESTRELFQAQQESLQTRISKENLLLNLPIGVVVVDRRYDILEINGAARGLLGIHTVAVGEDLVHLAQNVPNKAFRAAIDRAIREKTVGKLNEVHIPHMTTGEPTYLQIECYPQPGGHEQAFSPEGSEWVEGAGGEDAPVESVLVLVIDVTEMVQSRRELEQANARQSAQAEELAQTIANLQAANAALAAGNEETSRANAALGEARHKAEEVATRHAQQIDLLAEANRELLEANQEVTRVNSDLRSRLDDFLVISEEAQAAIEEAETLNEEMQATNEELETLNEELQATVEELNTSNADLAARGDELQGLASSLSIQQQHIEHEKAQLEAILAGLADAVLVVTPEGKPLLSNAAYRRLFQGDEAAELAKDQDGAPGDGLNAKQHPEGTPALMADEQGRPLLPDETPQARAARGETFSMSFTLASPSGDERRWLEAIGQPVRGEGGHERSEGWGVVVFRDITERSLRIMQEEFASLAAHELRTPLTAINGYLHLLAKSLKQQKGDERQLKYVQTALAQVDRQMRLVEDLLDVARLQSGKFSLRREPLRLDTLIEQVVETAKLLAKGQQIELTIGPEFAKDSVVAAAGENDAGDARDVGGPLLVNGDAARLEQAVLNLVTNAVTYAPGSARIDVRLVRVDGTATAMAEIDVQDYGKGIAAKDLSEVFTRFYQAGQGNPLPTQGLGLGLFITRQIVEAHGGTISVESTEGKGTTFAIKLPLLERKLVQRTDSDS